MDIKNVNQCVLVNRNYPPRAGMTGSTANELVQYLESRGVDVFVVTQKVDYCGGGIETNNIFGTIHHLRTFYNGKIKIIRFFSSLLDGWRLCRKAISLKIPTIICMSDPPLLNLWFSIFLRKNSFFWLYWSMDLYPEAFVSNKLVSPKNIFLRLINIVLGSNKPDTIISLGSNQLKFLLHKLGNIPYTVTFPAGIQNFSRNYKKPPWANNKKIVIGYVGNIGEAHNHKFILSAIYSIDPKRHTLVLSLYGSKADKVLKVAQNRHGVVICPYIPSGDLGFIDVQLVSLLPNWDNVCVPSKAFSAVCAGSALILNCSTDNDIWCYLKDVSWHLPADFDLEPDFTSLLTKVTKETLKEKKNNISRVKSCLEDIKSKAFEDLYCIVSSSQKQF